MSEPEYVETKHTHSEIKLLNLAVQAVELVYRGEMLGAVMCDQRGPFLCFRAGIEKDVTHLLRDLDWSAVVRHAEEFFE